jgi:hypothetical protein
MASTKVQQEVHRAAQEGIVNSDQLWGLYNRASAAVCWGGDCVGQGCAWLGVTHAVTNACASGESSAAQFYYIHGIQGGCVMDTIGVKKRLTTEMQAMNQ